ncbi:uncharacterized protein LOC119359322 [Triticum dicoccoides]|uniref:uncharacterized protein LOC119359322 n=1 Tax=Triticum dicoccoides TaxID=85692 RepID=UPI00188F3B04|nr:uncharacterized protein LOC119359322 [Triticum dicoccoides]
MAGGYDAMAGSGDDEDEEAMKGLYAGVAPAPAEDEEEVDEGYAVAVMKVGRRGGSGRRGCGRGWCGRGRGRSSPAPATRSKCTTRGRWRTAPSSTPEKPRSGSPSAEVH